MKRPTQRLALTALLALAPLPLLAAGTATLNTGSGNVDLSWHDAQTLRMHTAQSPGYMLLREGKIYMVNPEGSGMPPVLELSSMMQGLMQGDGQQNDPLSTALSTRVESVKPMGRKETVAGMAGEVYALTTTDDSGQSKTQEAVLSGNALAVEMTQAFMNLHAAMVGEEKPQQFLEALPGGQRGVLRVGQDMVVHALSGDAPAAADFDLPAAPMDMGSMMQQMMKQMQR